MSVKDLAELITKLLDSRGKLSGIKVNLIDSRGEN